MKFLLYIFLFLLTLLYGCHSSKYISTFSTNNLELGISKQDFIIKYGKPYNQEMSYCDSLVNDKLLYKEELYIGMWCVVTTAFYFENNKLVKQEVTKEERKYPTCKCQKH